MRFAVIAFVLLYAGLAGADTGSSSSTVRLGSKVISAGDTEKRVMDAGGEPSRRRAVIGRNGAQIGEDWIYSTGPSSYIIVRFNGEGMVIGVRGFTDR
ncbi:DUF2845 domain-containing protein [Tahibacter harae]|uniref:DUF2845 domain-containing protein n=1 Tax=Tahibacter harae TaxID=2963937 RepID=A0ABT1QRY4_9GAMM|nr:DUF2845 domain-containing protein [Tahibacter harae]MCQ4165021.1 DUF2845 domain-containing protein [Tahibacter harae]